MNVRSSICTVAAKRTVQKILVGAMGAGLAGCRRGLIIQGAWKGVTERSKARLPVHGRHSRALILPSQAEFFIARFSAAPCFSEASFFEF